MNILFVVAFGIYFLGLTLVGWWFYSRQKSASTFSLGNRSINYWVTAIATHATDMSAWLFMAFPGVIYATGLFAAWSAIGLTVFMFLKMSRSRFSIRFEEGFQKHPVEDTLRP